MTESQNSHLFMALVVWRSTGGHCTLFYILLLFIFIDFFQSLYVDLVGLKLCNVA